MDILSLRLFKASTGWGVMSRDHIEVEHEAVNKHVLCMVQTENSFSYHALSEKIVR